VDISVVIPCFNEEDSILPLARALHGTLISMKRSFEVIFVDDGSRDRTPQRLAEILGLDSRVRVIQLARNCGQTAALSAGIDHARGQYIVAMDADLQNDPVDIPRIVHELDRGFDVVSGWRRSRKDHFVRRRLPSLIANSILASVSGVKLHDFGCTLKGYRNEFLRRVPMYSDMHRYLPAFAASMGARVKEVEVRHHPRRFGRSKYGISRIYRVLMDILLLQMLVHFAFRPLHWFGLASVVAFWLCTGILLVSLFPVSDSALLLEEFSTVVFPSIFLLGTYLGTTLLSLGFVCELANRVDDSEMRQMFTVRDLETAA